MRVKHSGLDTPRLGGGKKSDYSQPMDNAPALDVFVPDGAEISLALGRSTHVGIGAHPDDLEIIAIQGILAGLGSATEWFTGVVACDGAGSPRSGPYADHSDADMVATRRKEQRDAAELGKYSAVIQLGYSSAAVRSGDDEPLVEDLLQILARARPRVLYLHNLADQHATHRALARSCIAALRRLAPDARPTEIYGVEVWGSLDWCPASNRVALPVLDGDGLQARLLRCHDSQINGGKRYDHAVIARQTANATLVESHRVDVTGACLLAMDLGPLLENDTLDIDDFLTGAISDFSSQVTS